MIWFGDRLDVGTQEEKELKDDVQVSSLGDREMVLSGTPFSQTLACSLTLAGFLLKCHIVREAFPIHTA